MRLPEHCSFQEAPDYLSGSNEGAGCDCLRRRRSRRLEEPRKMCGHRPGHHPCECECGGKEPHVAIHSKSQARHRTGTDDETPKTPSPAANTRFEHESTERPPNASIVRPMRGPRSAATSRAPENAAKNHDVGTCRSCAIGSARIAGR